MERWFFRCTFALFVVMAGACSTVQGTATAFDNKSAASGVERSELVGLWHLVRIDYSGPAGPLPDPFFGTDLDGLIVYDTSGWMSVQIARRERPRLPRTGNRTTGTNSPMDAQLKALALDSYYAYFGTWEYDPVKSVIVHHIKASVLPFETGVDLPREVVITGHQLSLVVHNKVNDEPRTRVLVWERSSPA